MSVNTYLYYQATHCIPTQRPPIWLMRQAGRYMPEYRALRKRYSFFDMIKTPELATEITLMPIQQFGFDAAILFSDILVTAEALGSPFHFVEKKGPVFDSPIQTMAQAEELDTRYALENLQFVFDAIRSIKIALAPYNVPLIGFAGAPFTVASYMIEGASSPDLKHVKSLIYHSPDLIHTVLEKLCTVTIDYLNHQIVSGVDALQLFDTWACHLSYQDFKTISLPYIKRIIKGLKNPNRIPITLFCKGSGLFTSLLIETGATVISLDWTCDLAQTAQQIPANIAIQGNLDPDLLYAPKPLLKERVQACLSAMSDRPGYIFNLGHGLKPDMDPDQVRTVVETVKEWSNTPISLKTTD